MKQNLLEIGVGTKTQGLKGTLKIVLHSDIKVVEPVHLELMFYQDKVTFTPLQVQEFSWKNHVLFVKFKNKETLSEVEFLKHRVFFVPKENLSFTKKTDWNEYQVNLGTQTTKVLATMNNGRQDLIKIKVGKKEFWVPMVEVYVDRIEEATKVIYLKNWGGLS